MSDIPDTNDINKLAAWFDKDTLELIGHILNKHTKACLSQMKELVIERKELKKRLAAAESKLLMSNALPKITDEIYNDYGFDVFIELIDGKPQWTQAAIDFAALLDEMKGKIESRKGE